jgi:hypothetical protein
MAFLLDFPRSPIDLQALAAPRASTAARGHGPPERRTRSILAMPCVPRC